MTSMRYSTHCEETPVRRTMTRKTVKDPLHALPAVCRTRYRCDNALACDVNEPAGRLVIASSASPMGVRTEGGRTPSRSDAAGAVARSATRSRTAASPGRTSRSASGPRRNPRRNRRARGTPMSTSPAMTTTAPASSAACTRRAWPTGPKSAASSATPKDGRKDGRKDSRRGSPHAPSLTSRDMP
jgi:hypothetical protein